MKKNDLKKMALMGITGGVMMAAQSPAIAHEGLKNIDTGNYLAAKCGGGNSCGGSTAWNGGGHSCASPQDPSTYNPQGYYPQNQSGCGNHCGGSRPQSRFNGGYFADNDDNATQDNSKPMTESEFKAKLSPQGKADYDKLSSDGKANALKIASHDCSGKNECKGQNACKTDKNDCAGKGGCKGQSKCAATPDQAVKAASLKDKRTSWNSRNNSSTNNYR